MYDNKKYLFIFAANIHFKIKMMKIIKLTILLAAVILSTDFASARENADKEKTNDETIDSVVVINKADFLKKIYNYEANRDSFIYEGTLPCIVDFYADWCGPCRMVSPIMKDLASEYKGKVIFYKINIDKNKELAMAFGATSIPMFLFIPAKGEPQSTKGALPREFFVKIIEEFLLKDGK